MVISLERAKRVLALVGITARCSSVPYDEEVLYSVNGPSQREYWRCRLIARAIRRVYW